MRPTALLAAIVLAAAACGAPADVEITAAGDAASPTASESDRTLDDTVADGIVGQDLADRADPDQFHPAMLAGPGQYAWYMNEPGWTDRFPDVRVDALCAWADQQDDLQAAVNEAQTEHADVGGSDGLDNVVATICDGNAVPSAWGRAADEGQLGPGDRGCQAYADPKIAASPSDAAAALCQRHQQQLSAAGTSDT